MLNVSQNNTNIPMGSAGSGFTMSSGIHNEFATPEVDDGKSTKKDMVRVFLIFALILTILLGMASYFYTSYLDSKVEAGKAALADIDSNPNVVAFEKNLPGMRELSKKLKLLNSVNDSRVYISGMLFPVLESVVESSRSSYVYFSNIDIKSGSQATTMSVSINGIAQDYLALSRQITNFRSGPFSSFFSDFKFLSLVLDSSNGQVKFSVSFNIDVSTNSYLTFLKAYNGGGSPQKNSPGMLFKSEPSANVFPEVSSSSSATSSGKKAN
jgi:hypothetical protein